MKKILCILAGLAISTSSFAQAWNIGLNSPAGNPSFGTANAKPIDFFTNNVKRMSLNLGGKLSILSMTGTCSRFLHVDASGQLEEWLGQAADSSKVLAGNNSWKSYPLIVSGSNVIMPAYKLGLNMGNVPATELDVNGGAQVANGLRVGEGLYIGSASDYGLIHYTPGTGGSPSVFHFGGGGSGHPNNPNPGNAYNPYAGGHGAGDYANEPLPSSDCTVGDIPKTINVFNDMICIKKPGIAAQIPPKGNINIGHNGVNAFIETQGSNSSYPNAGDLLLNSQCNRNIYAFSNGAPQFAASTDHVMSIAGRLNVSQNMQIGGGTSITTFTHNTAALFINAPLTTASAGLRIYHGGGNDGGIKIVELSTSKKALSIANGSSFTDNGNERFTVFGDGKTEITCANADALVINTAATSLPVHKIQTDGKTEIISSNTDALVIKNGSSSIVHKVLTNGQTEITSSGAKGISVMDANNSNTESFLVNANGSTEIKTNGSSAFAIKNSSNSNSGVFKVDLNGLTEITGSSAKAVSIKNASNNNNETFFVNSNGYTEIKVYSPSGMPSPYSAGHRAFTIRDMSNNKDIFAVNANGKAYAREFEISLTADFPDYVFEQGYELKQLSEVEAFIKTNKHLPGFENACYYEKNGLNVNTVMLKQQEKIEELTLYIIALEKRLQSLEQK